MNENSKQIEMIYDTAIAYTTTIITTILILLTTINCYLTIIKLKYSSN